MTAADGTTWRANAQERRAVERWRPARRWYHPFLAALVIRTSTLITSKMNALTIEGRAHYDAAMDRAGRGLITYANHVSMFDDPLLISNLAPREYDRIRWVASDAINFFGGAAKAWFFTAGKCVPLVRGAGIDQPGYFFLRDRLLEGDWVHIFPEGGRTRDPKALMSRSFKSSIGRLMDETRPLMLPYYHYGLHNVLPVGAMFPHRGNELQMVFGELWDSADAVDAAGETGPTRWERLSQVALEPLRDLERQVNPAAS
jgi:monolysocardiolipin acyltransferase